MAGSLRGKFTHLVAEIDDVASVVLRRRKGAGATAPPRGRRRTWRWGGLSLVGLLTVGVACGGGDGAAESTMTTSAALTCLSTNAGSSCTPPAGATTPPSPISPAWPSSPVTAAGGDLSLPGGGSVGADGQYHYTVPLDVPVGRMAMAPKLGLTYSSGAGNGPLGVGWSLTGLSTIMPCPRIQAIDKVSYGVTMSGSDALCLDGVRLFSTGFETYQTEVESYSQITQFVDTATSAPAFQVQTQTGMTRIYRQRGTNVGTGLGLTWLLDTEFDLDGNAVSYTYNDLSAPSIQDVGSGGVPTQVHEFSIASITYTNRMASGSTLDGASKVADTSGMRRVVFNYAPRADTISMRYGGSNPDPRCTAASGCNQAAAVDVRTTNLLLSVDMWAPIPSGSAGETSAKVWSYVMGYQPSAGTGRTLLTSVTKVGAQGGTSLARTFGYDSASGLDGGRWQKSSVVAPQGIGGGDLLWVGDQLYDYATAYADLLHDGQTLIITDTGAPGLHVSSISASGVASVAMSGLPPTLNGTQVVDLDADGVPEIVGPQAYPTPSSTGPQTGDYYAVYKLNVNAKAYSGTTTSVPYFDPQEYYNGQTGNPYITNQGYANQVFTVFSPIFFVDTAGTGIPSGIWGHHQVPGADTSCGFCVGLSCVLDLLVPPSAINGCLQYQWSTVPVANAAFGSPSTFYFGFQTLANQVAVPNAPFSPLPRYHTLALSDGYAGVLFFGVNAEDLAQTSDGTLSVPWLGWTDRNLPVWMAGTTGTPTFAANYKTSLDALDSTGQHLWAEIAQNNLTAVGGFDGRSATEEFVFTPALLPAGVDQVAGDWLVRAMDVDGDGRSDVVAYHASATVTKSNIDSAYLLRWDAAGNLQASPLTDIPLVIADFDGDGITDMIGGTLADLNSTGALFYRGVVRAHDRINYVGDQSGVSVNTTGANGGSSAAAYMLEEVAYATQPSTASSTGACGSYPVECVPGGMNVVLTHYVNTGGGVDPHEYAYGTERYDVLGRGFLGFDWVDDFDSERFTETISYYQLTAAAVNGAYLSGRPSRVSTFAPTSPFTSTSLTVRETDRFHYYSPFETSGKAYTIQEYEQVSEETEYPTTFSWSTVPHFGANPTGTEIRIRYLNNYFDAYGNVTRSSAATSGGITSNTTTTYVPPSSATFLRSLPQTVTTQSYSAGTSTPESRQVSYTYDPAHPSRVLTESTNASSSDPTVRVTTTYARSGDGVITGTTESAYGVPSPGAAYVSVPARTSTVVLDGFEGMFPSTTLDALNHATRTLVNPTFGVAQDIVDPNQVETRVTLDDFGREASRWNAAGTQVTTSRQPWVASGSLQGTQVTITSGTAAQPSVQNLDVRGHVVMSQVPHIYGAGWDVTTTSYDAFGRVTQVARPQAFGTLQTVVPAASAGAVNTVYDPLDRVIQTYAPDRSETTTTYTFFSSTTTDAMGNQTLTYYDRDSRLLETAKVNTSGVSGAQNAVAWFGYGQFDQVTTVEQNNVTWTAAFDLMGRRTSLTNPDAGTTTWTYDGFGDVLSELRPGMSTPDTFAYDQLGRQTVARYSDGTASYTYDTATMGIGKMAGATSEDGVVTAYGYDTRGRQDYTEWTIPTPGGSRFYNMWTSFDAQGRPSTVTYPWATSRVSTIDAYDASSGQLEAISQGSGGVLWYVASRAADGSLTAGYDGSTEEFTRSYDVNGRVATIQDFAPYSTTTSTVDLAYEYNADGTTLVSSDILNERGEIYYYDSLQRLTTWSLLNYNTPSGNTLTTTGYGYDNLGNLTTVTTNGSTTEEDTYGGASSIPQQTQSYGPHQLASQFFPAHFVSARYAYDPSGRQTYASQTRNQVTYKDYDLPKRIVDMQAHTTSFAYDASRARVLKTSGVTGTSTITLGGLFEARLNAAFAPTEYVLYVPGSDGMTTQLSVTAGGVMTTEYLHADKLGNVVAVTSPTAAADAKYYYDPFGRRINATDQIVSVGTPDVQLGFGAQEMDDDLELVNMHGRIYDPYERRFMSVDPHVTNPKNALSYNPYTYVLNSPVNGTDPTGFDADSESDGADPGASWGWTDYFNGSSGTYSDNAFPVGTSPPATPDGASAGYTPATDVESDMSVWEIENDPYGFEETTAPQVPAAGPARHVVGADEAATNAAFLNILARNGSIYYQNIIPGTIHYNEATDSYLGTPRTTGVIEMGDPWNYKPNLVVDLDYPRSTEVDPDPSEFQIWARRADMGGGAVQKLSDFGWDNLTYGHEWVYHPASGAEAGMGPVPGTPGGFGGPTQMNDHRGAHGDASAILMTTVNVGDPQAVLNAMKVGTDTGRWYGPGMNDCHTAAETAVFGPPAPSMIGSYKFLLMP